MELTIAHAKGSAGQHARFELAVMATELRAAQDMVDQSIRLIMRGDLGPAAAMTKLFRPELQGRVVDRCLRLLGEHGYEHPVAWLCADARVTRIYGGTSEALKTIISKSIGL